MKKLMFETISSSHIWLSVNQCMSAFTQFTRLNPLFSSCVTVASTSAIYSAYLLLYKHEQRSTLHNAQDFLERTKAQIKDIKKTHNQRAGMDTTEASQKLKSFFEENKNLSAIRSNPPSFCKESCQKIQLLIDLPKTVSEGMGNARTQLLEVIESIENQLKNEFPAQLSMVKNSLNSIPTSPEEDETLYYWNLNAIFNAFEETRKNVPQDKIEKLAPDTQSKLAKMFSPSTKYNEASYCDFHNWYYDYKPFSSLSAALVACENSIQNDAKILLEQPRPVSPLVPALCSISCLAAAFALRAIGMRFGMTWLR